MIKSKTHTTPQYEILLYKAIMMAATAAARPTATTLPLTSAAAPAAGDGVAVGTIVSVFLLPIDEWEVVDLLLGLGIVGVGVSVGYIEPL